MWTRFWLETPPMSDGKIEDLLVDRRDAIRQWLRTETARPEIEQAHLDTGSREQAYWSHGYQSALSDVINILSDGREQGNGGTASH